jgi:predicted CoA-binding protein
MLNSKNKPTLILGASENPNRISFQAATRLMARGEEVFLIGRGNSVNGVSIHKELLAFKGIDTITLYLNPKRQEEYYSYVVDLKPKRVIFNPGTENPEFESKLQEEGIETERACTLVLLSIGTY